MKWIGQHIYDLTARFRNKVIISPNSVVGTSALTVDNSDVDQIALDINADNTTANIIDLANRNTSSTVLLCNSFK